MLDMGAVEVGSIFFAPHSFLWNDQAADILNAANAGTTNVDEALSQLGAILGPNAVRLDSSGQLVVASSSPIECGFLGLFACEIQADGTFANVGLAFGFGLLPFFLGMIPLMTCMMMWWRDVVREAHVEGHHTPISLGLRYGMLLFIISEIFFVAFLGHTEFLLFNPWPSGVYRGDGGQGKSLHAFNPLGIPPSYLSCCYQGQRYPGPEALRENRLDAFKNWLAVTVLLGIFFTIVQVYEYTQLPFGFSDFNFESSFCKLQAFMAFMS